MGEYNTASFELLRGYRISFFLITIGLLIMASVLALNPINYFSVSVGASATLLKMSFDTFKNLCFVEVEIRDRRD